MRPDRASAVVGVAVYVALGTAAMATLGMAITAFTPTVDAVSSVGPFTRGDPLVHLRRVHPARACSPTGWRSIGRVFPLAPLADGLQRAVTGVGGGTGLTAHNVGLLAAWGAVGLVVAARRFRWVPQGVGA